MTKREEYNKSKSIRATIVGSRAWLHNKCSGIRARAKRKNIEYNLKVQDMALICANREGLCPYCERQMMEGDKSLKPTFDRLDNSKGYIVGNVLLVCMQCNLQKSHLSKKQIINLYNLIMKNGESN